MVCLKVEVERPIVANLVITAHVSATEQLDNDVSGGCCVDFALAHDAIVGGRRRRIDIRDDKVRVARDVRARLISGTTVTSWPPEPIRPLNDPSGSPTAVPAPLSLNDESWS